MKNPARIGRLHVVSWNLLDLPPGGDFLIANNPMMPRERRRLRCPCVLALASLPSLTKIITQTGLIYSL